MVELLVRIFEDVLATLVRVWPFLLISVLAAASIAVYAGADRASRWIGRRALLATVGAVALAALTPFCSCGTTAVLLGMLATSAPWAPLVAFMVASPLTSPSELIFSAGLFGWGFALVFFVGTIVLGLAAGAAAGILDRVGWLRDQARVRSSDSCATGACPVEQPVGVSLGPGAASVAEFRSMRDRLKLDELVRALWKTGRKLVTFFLAFTFVGYLAIEAIPTMWLTAYLGEGSALGVPLAAILGIPVYVNTEASLPLVAAMMEGGMGPGPAMAFLVTGAGTSVGAISGLFVIARKRVVGLVVAMLLVGSVVLGWFSQLVL